jgi:hypothetical protein
MTGLVRKATLLSACGMLFAAVAMAGVPSPGNCKLYHGDPSGLDETTTIHLTGSAAGVPDSVSPSTSAAVGKFCVEVRDLAGALLGNSSVVIDASNETDALLCDDQLNANYLLTCAAATVRAFTAPIGDPDQGIVCFNLIGGSDGGGNATELLNAGRIYADGVLIFSPSIAVYDLDNNVGVGANDLSAWFGDFGDGNPYSRSDYDDSGSIGANDLSLWFGVFGDGGSTDSCVGNCP